MSDHPIIPADQMLPVRLFVVPLHGKPIFPGILTPMMIPSAADADTVEKAIAADSFIGLVLTKVEDAENPTAEYLQLVGTAAKCMVWPPSALRSSIWRMRILPHPKQKR